MLKNISNLLIATRNNIKKSSPEIGLAIGIVGIVSGTVMACMATTKLPEIKAEHEKLIEAADDEQVTPDEKERQANHNAVNFMYGVTLAKLYLPAALTMTASICCIVCSHKILKRRNATLLASYTTLAGQFNEYRQRVVEKFGKDTEKEIRYNIKNDEVIDMVEDSKGKMRPKKQKVPYIDPTIIYDDYTAYFCQYTSWHWNPSEDYNRMFLENIQNWENDKLKATKHLYLNEVLKDLGISDRPSGQVLGWIKSKEADATHDNYIDFRATEAMFKDPETGALTPGFLLDFNADGNILKDAYKEKENEKDITVI